MKLLDYMWDIFKIGTAGTPSKADDVDLGVAPQMFYNNCDEGRAIHPGTPNLDYAKLQKDYESTPDLAEQKKLVSLICNKRFGKYEELCAAFRRGDRKAFDAIVDEFEAAHK